MRVSEILLIGIALTGAIWALDVIFWRPRRMMYVLSQKDKQESSEPWLVEYAKSFFPILLVVFLLRAFLVEGFVIPSGSMRPTLLEGDFVAVNKFDYGLRVPLLGNTFIKIGIPKRGDVIVFKAVKNGQSIDMIKRVVGLPHDQVQYKNKTIYINGELVKQEFQGEKLDKNLHGIAVPVRELVEHLGQAKHKLYVDPTTGYETAYQYEDVMVPENHYFVMGDNRDGSLDSRFWGFVKNEDIQGRAFMVWMSFEGPWYWPWPIRWDRLGWIQ